MPAAGTGRTHSGRIVRDPRLSESTRGPVVGNLMSRCYAAAPVLARNEQDWQRNPLVASVLEDSVKSGRAWNQVLQRLAPDVGEHRRGKA